MADIDGDLNVLFAPHNTTLPQDVQGELQSIIRIHSVTPQELFYKWESYSMKMGSEGTKLDLRTARDFKKTCKTCLNEMQGRKTICAVLTKGVMARHQEQSRRMLAVISSV